MKQDKEKKVKLNDFWKRLWVLLKPSHKQIKWLLFLICLLELTRLLGPYFLKLIIDLLTDFEIEKIDKIFYLILAMFLSFQLSGILNYIFGRIGVKVGSEVEAYLPCQAQKKLLNLSLKYHEKENTGTKISKVSRGVDRVVGFLDNLFWGVVPTVFQTISTTIILFIIDYRFGLVFLFFVPIFIFLTLKINIKVQPFRKKRHETYDESSGLMAQGIININTVKSFVQEDREEEQFSKKRKEILEIIKKEFKILFNYNYGRGLVIDLGMVFMLLFGVFLAWQGDITIGSLVFVIIISEKAMESLFRISRLYDRIMESSEAIDKLYFLQQEKNEINDSSGNFKPKKIIGQIKFKDVNFAYDNEGQKALNNINLTINSGCLTALVGPSGGGKTTVAKMIYRHYDPQSGQVLLDDRDIREYDLKSFRKFISIVPQEVEIFNSSVRDNIAYGKPKASLKEIKAAARIANAEVFIEKMTSGYNTLVGERGVKLSGGQRQRIGIARAILADPAILIFDEATSNLDSQSEKLIQDAMDKISRGRTTIIIAHRLSTIRKADKIVVLENGQVVEEGSHYELAQNKGGLYARLNKLQIMGDIE